MVAMMSMSHCFAKGSITGPPAATGYEWETSSDRADSNHSAALAPLPVRGGSLLWGLSVD